MRFLNTSDLLGPDWRFLADVCDDPTLSWETFSGRPRNALERRIRRPALARWRAALEATRAARTARDPAILVSHLPLMTEATNVLRRRLAPEVPQVAFAFNFTDLPIGRRRALMARGLAGIAEFVVFSRFEQGLYADLFGLPASRIRFLPWAMDPPVPGPESPVPEAVRQAGYLSAIGGEGRDYALLAEVLRSRPGIRAVVVGRPYSVAGIRFPENVTVFTNLPGPVTWRIAADSQALVIPLKTDRTACGHITMVGAQLLGLPLVVTRSQGVADYVSAATAQIVPPGDGAALGAALERVLDDPAAIGALARQARLRAETENRLPRWVAYFQDLAGRMGR